ncbi:MAG: hypothetical protein JWP01_1170 [Myxococcales bacterium]|nr:hypothetical protein [Myxococcales bacterium]
MEAEELEVPGAAFERTKRRVGLFAGPVVAVALALLARDGASPALVGLLVLCVVWWLTEALPMAVVALLAAVGAVLTGIATPKQAFGAFGTPLLFLFVGSFFIAEAMRRHGLGVRIGRAMVRRARGRLSLLILIGMTAFVQSMFMSNAATTAILLPIAISVAPVDHLRDRFGGALVLAVAWGASVGGLGTPVGTPPNLIGIAELEKRGLGLGFVEWMAIGVPMGTLMMLGLFVVLAVFFKIRRGQPLAQPLGEVSGPWNRGERAVVIAAAIALTGWLTPTLLTLVAPGSAAEHWADVHLTEEIVALIAGCSLFVIPGARAGEPPRPALLWSEATRIEWGVILLFGGGILLGDLARSTGLAVEWGHAFVDATGASSTWAIAALVTAVAIVLSEMTSNTATATLMAPLAGSLAEAAGAAPIPAILGATMGASFGFMMPISTAPNALAFSTGRISITEMVRAGIVFDVIGFALILAALRIMCPLLGWA